MTRDIRTEEPYEIALAPPNIERYRAGYAGIPYALSYEAERPGAHIMVTALVHGNEYAGAIALDWLLRHRLRPSCGRLTLCFANVEAFLTFDQATPLAARKLDRDLNRVWSTAVLDGPDDDRELQRARQLRPLIETVDFLLDLHTLRHIAAPLILCGRHGKGRRLAAKLGFPSWVVSDFGHAEGRRLRDYGDFDHPDSPRTALLVECGQHWRRETADVAVDTVLGFLRALEALPPTFAPDRLRRPVDPQRHVEVTGAHTISSDSFQFVVPFDGFEIVAEAGTLIAVDGEQEIRTPHDHCVIVMPSRNWERGTTAVRFGVLTSSALEA